MNETANVYIYNSTNPKSFQTCCIPVDIFSKINGKVGSYLKVETNDFDYICQAVPVYGSHFKVFYQVIVTDCVSVAKTDNSESRSLKCSVFLSSLKFLDVKALKEVQIKVTVLTPKNVVNYRKNSKKFSLTVHDILSSYKIVQYAVVRCINNSVAKLLGITSIYVEKCSKIANEIGSISLHTKILISEVESEWKKKCKVKTSITLGGLESIYEKLKNIILAPWENRNLFKKYKITYPSGILLIGPPGCGKTSLVKKLCYDAGICLISTAGADVITVSTKKSLINFNKIIKEAYQLSEEGPCVLFIDEIDSLCPVRSRESSVSAVQLAAMVMTSIEKCYKYKNITVIAATNRPYALDPALRRPGRLDFEVMLNVPNISERRDILQVYCNQLFQTQFIECTKVSEATPGFVGADLKNLCNIFAFELNKESANNTNQATERMVASAKSLTPTILKTLDFITAMPCSFAIGGLKDVKMQLERIFTHCLKYSKIYTKLRLRRPRGVLLFGPRGCGKTRLIADLSSKLNCTFISANASHLLSSYVGDSEKRVAALFHTARISQPSIVFIDEIDGIIGKRSGNGKEVSNNILTEFLQAMDGAGINISSLQGSSFVTSEGTSYTDDGVLICAATNRPSALDPAILRPGRFDKLIYIPLPDEEARRDIIKIKTEKLEIDIHPHEMDSMIKETKGYTGAEIENIVRKVITELIKCNSDTPRMEQFVSLFQTALMKSCSSVTDKEIKYFEDFNKFYENYFVCLPFISGVGHFLLTICQFFFFFFY